MASNTFENFQEIKNFELLYVNTGPQNEKKPFRLTKLLKSQFASKLLKTIFIGFKNSVCFTPPPTFAIIKCLSEDIFQTLNVANLQRSGDFGRDISLNVSLILFGEDDPPHTGAVGRENFLFYSTNL